MTAALNAVLVSNATSGVIKIGSAPVFVDCNNFNVMDFADLSLNPIYHINAPTAPGVVAASVTAGATPPTATQFSTTAVITAKAVNQALIA